MPSKPSAVMRLNTHARRYRTRYADMTAQQNGTIVCPAPVSVPNMQNMMFSTMKPIAKSADSVCQIL